MKPDRLRSHHPMLPCSRGPDCTPPACRAVPHAQVPYKELVSRIQAAFPDTPLERLDDPKGEVAKNFRLQVGRGGWQAAGKGRAQRGRRSRGMS